MANLSNVLYLGGLKIWAMKYPEEVKAFGMRIRALREEAGCSQQELADYTDINKKTFQK